MELESSHGEDPSTGFVRNVAFENILMNNVKNPIIIDQNYCPHEPRNVLIRPSGVKISEVTYRNIRGTSANKEAVTFDCSPGNPCKGINLQVIKLTYKNEKSKSEQVAA
ncbi:hypothetical protein Patl1_24825 [Pistacia atlantica]|uniref:Uncharacterized protein n=1 Tax=Pistacia atlantica TaxID=434234 RepID=A0ACC1B3N8_9ROSI|nr:hypothetical protein Patl1_24825 [Pistacia atlantica]